MVLRAALFISILQLTNINIYSQLTVTTLKLGRDNGGSYSFPLIHSVNPRPAQKINYYLQKERLYNDTILTDTNSVFEKSRFINGDSSDWQAGYTYMSYEVGVNNPRILSLKFQVETMGAYPESYPFYYNFQVQTGGPVSAKDLFTPAGIIEIRKALRKERQKRIKEWMKEMDTTYNIKDEREYINETFTNCNAEASEDNFMIWKNSIVFVKEYCFPHVARPYDIDLDIEFAFRKIEQFLSDNGKKLLLQKH